MNLDPLFDAAIAGDADARAKLEIEADKLDFIEQTILHTQSENGNAERVRFILREFAHKNLLTKITIWKLTALHKAIYGGPHTEVVEVLIEAARHLPSSSANDVTSFQAFLRQADEDMNTALHFAVKYGHADIVKLLVEADPTDRHIQNHRGKTPMYIAVKRGYLDMVKIMCTTCTVVINLDGPGSTTALHALIKYLDKDEKEKRDLIKLIINAVKIVNIPEDAESLLSDQINRERDERLVQLFKKTDEDRCTILELAVEGNYPDVVELILAQNPAYQRTYHLRGRLDHDMVGLLPLIYKADDKYYKDVLKLLNQRFETLHEMSSSIRRNVIGNMAPLLSAIRSRHLERFLLVLDILDTKFLVNFIDDVGWTALHHAAYHEFNEVIKPIVEAQKKFGHEFVYPDRRPTPFHVAAQKGFTSTVILLFQLWPSSSSAYIAIDKDGQNILHIAALQNRKEMIQAILKHCPEEHKKQLVNKQDNNGDTPLHMLISHGCFVPELLRYQGLDTTVENHNSWTPPDMLYVEDKIIDDQVKIKIALDQIQIDHKRDLFSSSELSISEREEKDAIMKKQANQMIHQMHARMKGDTRAFANCFADAIAGDPISKAALGMEADTVLQEEGKTILHVESMRGVTERVEYILREFANKNLLMKLDTLKQTALHLAAHHGHTQVVEALIEAARHLPSWSANDDTRNPIRSFQDFIRQTDGQMGNTALHVAVLKGNVAIVKLLVQADPNDNHVQNNEGKTPLYIAAEKGYKVIVKEICTTCTALSVDGPGGRTTALHALIQNIGQDVGFDMTTESLPKEQLAEPQDEAYSLQRFPDLDMELIGKGNSSINVINKTCTEETSEGKKPEKVISYKILSEHFGKPLADAAEIFHVSRSTFKRMCRDHGIPRWKSSKRSMGSHNSSKHRTVNEDGLSMNSCLMVTPPLQDDVVTVPQTSQDMKKINVKATYKGTAIRFELLDSSGMIELEDMVIERLKLKRHTFSIKYQDDEGDWVLIACDNDVQKCIEISRSLKVSIIKMLVDLPISG